MKIGDRVFVHGYIDEIRKDIVIIRNNGGYFGTVPSEVVTGGLPSAQPERKKGHWVQHPEQKNIYGGKCVECSECGEKYVVQYIEDEKFCRNCGADMRGGQE